MLKIQLPTNIPEEYKLKIIFAFGTQLYFLFSDSEIGIRDLGKNEVEVCIYIPSLNGPKLMIYINFDGPR
ncbi:MAG: hypothetical protein NDF55_04430 [archaeon GB-1867-005]|nr:hypothetical protein [Candidatus Culexmicrobium cathedralense]